MFLPWIVLVAQPLDIFHTVLYTSSPFTICPFITIFGATSDTDELPIPDLPRVTICRSQLLEGDKFPIHMHPRGGGAGLVVDTPLIEHSPSPPPPPIPVISPSLSASPPLPPSHLLLPHPLLRHRRWLQRQDPVGHTTDLVGEVEDSLAPTKPEGGVVVGPRQPCWRSEVLKVPSQTLDPCLFGSWIFAVYFPYGRSIASSTVCLCLSPPPPPMSTSTPPTAPSPPSSSR